MMKGLIRQHGFSDTAAAEGVGVSSSTISRWKKHDPELAAELLRARYECRIHHLENIEKAAAAENGRGWRASAWMLERLFPGDYSPRMAERLAYMNLQDKIRDREASALVFDDVQIRLAEEQEQRARAAAEAEQRASASEGGSRNSRNAEGTEPSSPAEEMSIASEPGSRNSRNSAPMAPHHTQQAAAPAKRQQAAAVQGSDAVPADASFFHSETASRNSRNSAEPEQRTAAPAFFTASDDASRNSRNAPRGGTPSAQFPSGYGIL